MALLKCKDCGGQVSTGAKACPHCGTRSFKSNSAMKILAIIFFLPVMVGLCTSENKDGGTKTEISQGGSPNAGDTGGRKITSRAASGAVKTKKADWWVIMFHECKPSEKPPEEFVKAFPCKIIDRNKSRGLVFLKCDFETATPGETVGTNLVFANSKRACDTALEQVRRLESEGVR